MELPGTQVLEPSLLPSRVSTIRKLASEAEPGLEPRHSDTGCWCDMQCLSVLTTASNACPFGDLWYTSLTTFSSFLPSSLFQHMPRKSEAIRTQSLQLPYILLKTCLCNSHSFPLVLEEEFSFLLPKVSAFTSALGFRPSILQNLDMSILLHSHFQSFQHSWFVGF